MARREMGEWSIPYNLEGLASAALAQGQVVRAAQLLGAAEEVRETTRWPLTTDNRVEHERWIKAIHAQLAPAAFEAAWAAGRAMSTDQAIDYALAAGYGALRLAVPRPRALGETREITSNRPVYPDRPGGEWYTGLSGQWWRTKA